jgi:hypothetical protein
MEELDNPGKALGSLDIEDFLAAKFHNMKDFMLHIDEIKSSAYDQDTIFGEHRHSRLIFLENSGTRIGHFTLLSDLGESYEFFDPTGTEEPPQPIADFARVNNKRLVMLKKEHRLQSPNTFTCGKWCILRYFSLPTTLEEFAEIFLSKKKIEPDVAVDRLIKVKTKHE